MQQQRRWGDGEAVGSRLAVVENEVATMTANFGLVFSKLDALSLRLAGRPSWGITALITLQTALNVGLIVDVLAKR